AVEMELWQIAQLAARSENKPGDSIEQLIESGMLPEGFGKRADGSRLEVVDGVIVDSLRGGRGSFVPVPDVGTTKVTPAEMAGCRRGADYYQGGWGAMDPVVVGIQRQPLPDSKKLERVVLDLRAAPLSQKHIDLLNQWLGPPTDQRLAPLPGNIVSFEAV